MHVVGLTGGIGSGKSTIAAMLREQELPVVDADLLGHEAYEPGTGAHRRLLETFGEDLRGPDGRIDRRKLGGIVFGKPDQMRRLTDIVWPEIRRLAEERLRGLADDGAKMAVLEAAVLFEAGWESLCDEVWAVVAPEELAVRRVHERNGLSEADTRARIRSQMTNEERVRRSDVVIENAGTLEELRVAVEKALAGARARAGAAA